MRKILVADLFCGAGGSSTGAERALRPLGFDVQLYCLNHWDLALETHKRMHPSAIHYNMPIEKARPTQLVPGGRLDLLMASPTCTHHSRARGGRPTSDQQRADPWHVLLWLTELEVDRILIENVWEYTKWGPVDPDTGRPIKEREGEYHNAWTAALDAVGFDYVYKRRNFADFGDATTRERYIGMGRHRRLRSPRPSWPAFTHAKLPGDGQLPWVPARVCIDWSVRGTSIYRRRRPLAGNSLQRIYSGITRFEWPARYSRRLRRYMQARDISVPRVKYRPRETDRQAEPFIDVLRANAFGVSIDDPLRAICAGGQHHALVEPFILSQASGGAPRPVSRPFPTLTTGGQQGEGTALIAPYYGSGSGLTAKSVNDPLDAITTLARFGLIVPVTNGSGGNTARSVDQPFATFTTAKGGEFAMASPDPVEDDADILYRMLLTTEMARATSFTTDEDGEYQFAGSKRDVTKQIGNAVPIKGWAKHVEAVCSDLIAGYAPAMMAAD